MSADHPRIERRDTSPAGLWNRAQFELSVGVLRLAGFSDEAIQYFKRRARETHRLPHQLLVGVMEDSLRGIGVIRS